MVMLHSYHLQIRHQQQSHYENTSLLCYGNQLWLIRNQTNSIAHTDAKQIVMQTCIPDISNTKQELVSALFKIIINACNFQVSDSCLISM
jgi:hypothetical protein